MRIVSLACSNTEIVHALGASHQLVGVDSHSDFPRSILRGLPQVGPDLEIDVDRVVALKPDLVLASLTVPGHETVVEGMEAAGVPLLTLAPESLDDVPRSVETIARRIGREAAGRELADRLRRELLDPVHRAAGSIDASRATDEPASSNASASSSASDASDGSASSNASNATDAPASSNASDADSPLPSVLIQWWPKPVIAPGARSWIHGLLQAAGATHPLATETILSRPLDDEEVAQADPDAIVLAWCGVEPAKYRPDVVMRNPAFRDIRAVRNGRVHLIPEAWLGRPGPRLLEGLRALRGVVRELQTLPSTSRPPRHTRPVPR